MIKIGLTGVHGSGKTTKAKELEDHFADLCITSDDTPVADIFEQSIEYYLANLDKAIIDGNYSTKEYIDGQRGGLKFALATYRDCKKELI